MGRRLGEEMNELVCDCGKESELLRSENAKVEVRGPQQAPRAGYRPRRSWIKPPACDQPSPLPSPVPAQSKRAHLKVSTPSDVEAERVQARHAGACFKPSHSSCRVTRASSRSVFGPHPPVESSQGAWSCRLELRRSNVAGGSCWRWMA